MTLGDGTVLFNPVEGVATYETTPAGADFDSRLQIRLTSFTNACGIARASELQGGGVDMTIILARLTASASGAPLPTPGSYSYVAAGSEVLDVPAYRGAWVDVRTSDCHPGLATQDSPTGELVLTTVTPTLVEGTYRFDAGACCIELSGSFSVPILDCAPVDPGAEVCCLAP